MKRQPGEQQPRRSTRSPSRPPQRKTAKSHVGKAPSVPQQGKPGFPGQPGELAALIARHWPNWPFLVHISGKGVVTSFRLLQPAPWLAASPEPVVELADWRTIIHAEDHGLVGNLVEKLRNREETGFELRLLSPPFPTTAAGTTAVPAFRWVRGFARLLTIEDPTGIWAAGSLQDITQERQVLQGLRESEEKFRLLAEESPNMIFINKRGRVVFANRQCEEVMGYTREEFYSPRFDFLSLIAPESVDYVRQAFQAHMQGTSIAPRDYDLITKDGRRINSLISTNLIRFEGERAILGIITDITERVTVERKLQESERTYRAIFEASPDALLLETLDGEILDCNTPAAALFALPREQLRGRKAQEFASPGARAAMDRLIPADLQNDAAWGETEMVDARGRSFPVDVRTRRTLIGDRPAIVVCVRDLTERKQAEEDRRRFEQRVQHAQKMESLGMLAGGIAHDFNNLLTGILGFADLALQEMPAGAPGRDRVTRIMTAARRAADLTSQMLAYTGRAKTQAIPVHLADLVREMGHLLEVSMSRKHRLEVVTTPGVSPIEADPTQIRQVVMNLIINASEAIGDRPGTIRVSLGQRTCRPEELAAGEIHDPLPAGEYAFLEVADPGSGIPPEVLPRIFEPFFSTKFAGRGLGLAAVLGIVRAHRGTIQVESRPGKGSTFRVWLPVPRHAARKEAALTPAAPAGAPSPWTGHGTVLVIDDEAPIRDLACSMLGRLGFEVVVGRDGEEGLDVFQALSGQIVAVLLDLIMPRLDGRETLARLRRLDPHIPVLLFSGFSPAQARAGLGREGPTGFLSKPFTSEELEAALRRLLTGRTKRPAARRRTS